MKKNKQGDATQALTIDAIVNANSTKLSVLSELFDNFSEAVIVADTKRIISYVNVAAEHLFGYVKDDLYGKATNILYAHERDFSEQGNKRFNTHSNAETENYRVAYCREDGEHFLGLTTGAVMRSAKGEVLGFIGIIRPARSADESLDTLQKIHNITSDITLNHDQKVNALLEVGLQHFDLDMAIVSHIVDNNYVVEDCIDSNNQLEPLTRFDLSGTYCVHTLKENKTVGFHFAGNSVIRNHPCYLNFKLESYIGTPISLDGTLYGTINFSGASPSEPFCKDDFILMEVLSDTLSYLLYKKKSEEAMMALVRTDELTGLLNRRATLERLSEQIKLSDRAGFNLTVLSIDIDYFKQVNDQWGHAAGDVALVEFARVVSSMGRETDFCGRIGGEEFIFVLPDANLDDALSFGNKLRQRLSKTPINCDKEQPIILSISVGLAMYENSESLEKLLARADDAMYRAKRSGRDRVCK